MSDHSTEKQKPWLLPACKNQHMPAGIYLVSTPIGNLADITVRALEVLSRADLVVCEDKRVTGKLLKSYEISKPLFVYNDHSTEKDRGHIVAQARAGQMIAVVSDAGMPLISDPGYKLVQACIENEIYLTSLPGANAPLTALQLSGLPSELFIFLGFLPSKTAARQAVLREWALSENTLIAFESPARILKMLRDVFEVMGNRKVAVVRELTKLHEEIRRSAVSELIAYYEDGGEPKGEIVVVIEGQKKTRNDVHMQLVKEALVKALVDMKTKDAVRLVSQKFGLQSSDVYDLALEIKRENS